MLNPELRIAIKELIEQTKNVSNMFIQEECDILKDKIFNLIKQTYLTTADRRDLYSNTGEIEQIIKEVFEE